MGLDSPGSPIHDPLLARNFYKEEVNPASPIRSLKLNFYSLVRYVLL